MSQWKPLLSSSDWAIINAIERGLNAATRAAKRQRLDVQPFEPYFPEFGLPDIPMIDSPPVEAADHGNPYPGGGTITEEYQPVKVPRGISSKMPGYYRGYLKKGGRSSYSPYELYGFNGQLQGGNLVKGANDVWIGTTHPYKRVFDAVISGLYAVCFRKTGQTLVNWADTPESSASLKASFIYKLGANAQSIDTGLFGLTSTHFNNSVTIANKIYELCVAGNQFELLQLHILNDNSASDYAAEVDCENATVQVYCRSTLVVQNRTPASSTSDTSTDIRSNPLIVKRFSGDGNTIEVRDYLLGAGSVNAQCIGDSQNGLMTPNTIAAAKGLVSKSDFTNVKQVAKSHLEPGGIKKDSIYTFTRCSLNGFIWKMRQMLNAADPIGPPPVFPASKMRWGKFVCLEFEKLCDIRLDEQEMEVGYEVLHNFGAFVKVTRKRKPCPRFTVDLGRTVILGEP